MNSIPKYWVHSDTRDYIKLQNGVYRITIIPRGISSNIIIISEGHEMPAGQVVFVKGFYQIITKQQFDLLKGFIPIKQKKLFARKRVLPKTNAPEVKIPTIADIREQKLQELGINERKM